MLPDQTIHGTQRHHFEIHDLTDVSGGKWKAVHIPDEDISSMLEVANHEKGGSMSMDIQHEDLRSQSGKISDVQIPVEVHGRVHGFEHSLMKNKSKNGTSSVKIIIAEENELRGREVAPLHTTQPSVIKLRGYMKEEVPKNREIIHRKTAMKPSLIVARIPDDDDADVDDLPLRKLPTPVVAPLRKIRPRVKPGSMRSDILAGTINAANKPRAFLTFSKVTTPRSVAQKSKLSQDSSFNKTSSQIEEDAMVLDKIKSLLLKSNHDSKQPSTKINALPRLGSESQATANQKTSSYNLPTNVPLASPNNDGPFLPSKFERSPDAFRNHASILNRITEPKREALLLGIIKALLARYRQTSSSTSRMTNGGPVAELPHHSRQAIMQGLQNLQMSKTVGHNEASLPGTTGTRRPAMPAQNLDEMYQKEREQQVKQELGTYTVE